MSATATGTLEPRPGTGTRIAKGPMGYAVSNARKRSGYAHVFRPAMAGGVMTFTLGVVLDAIAIVPTIKGIPINGDEKNLPPALEIDVKVAGDSAQSWVRIEATPNANGELEKESKVEMVHANAPKGSDISIAYCPVAMILWRNGIAIQVLPILMFNPRLERRIIQSGTEAGTKEYFFR